MRRDGVAWRASTVSVTLTVPVAGSTAGAIRSMVAMTCSPDASATSRTVWCGARSRHMTLGHADVGVQRVEIGEVVDRDAVGDGRADVEVTPEDLPRERRADHRALELELRARLRVPRILELATGRLVFLVADQFLVVKSLGALEFPFLDLEGGTSAFGFDALLVVLENGERLLLRRPGLPPSTGSCRMTPWVRAMTVARLSARSVVLVE